MRELLLNIQRDLKRWHRREPEDIALVLVSKKELGKLNMLIEKKVGVFSQQSVQEKKEMFFDGDFRKEPETDLFCAYCQRDLDANKLKYYAYVSFDGPPTIFNPKFKDDFNERSIQIVPIGTECSKHLEKEWLIENNYENSIKDVKKKIEIDLEYAKDIYKILEDMESMGMKMVSYKIKDIVSKEAFSEITKIYMEYHNANCGPFNRHLKKLIKEESFNKNKEKKG